MTTSVNTVTQIHPMGDRVVIRPIDEPGISAGGIILPDTAKERPQEGEVLTAGPGRVLNSGKRVEMELKPGDKVIYSKYAGTEVSVEDEELLIMNSGDILAKIS